MPEHDKMNELLSFFEHTYIRGRRARGRGQGYGAALFPVETWNQHAAAVDGIARTTNSVEGWHHGLQSLYQCDHPTVWTSLDGIKRDISKQKALFLQGVTGVTHPAAKVYRTLHERVSLHVPLKPSAERKFSSICVQWHTCHTPRTTTFKVANTYHGHSIMALLKIH